MPKKFRPNFSLKIFRPNFPLKFFRPKTYRLLIQKRAAGVQCQK